MTTIKGFTVAEEIKVAALGVSVTNAFVTVKETYQHGRRGLGTMGLPMMLPGSDVTKPYVISCQYYVYAADSADLQPLQQLPFYVELATVPTNPLATLYAALKADKFPGMTLTDTLVE